MPLLKLVVSSCADSVLPRDRTVNTFYLNNEGLGTGDADQLAQDAIGAFQPWYGAEREMRCDVYDARQAPPSFPVGSAVVNTGVAPASVAPREVAICLSYYGERNLPRTRGRMFLGVATAGKSVGGVNINPTFRTQALELGNRIAALGGNDIDWQVYSRVSDAAENVQHMFVDDEWDTIRSRGMIATTRSTADISE